MFRLTKSVPRFSQSLLSSSLSSSARSSLLALNGKRFNKKEFPDYHPKDLRFYFLTEE